MKVQKRIINLIFFLSLSLIVSGEVFANDSEMVEEQEYISENQVHYRKYSKDGRYLLEGKLTDGKKDEIWVERKEGTYIYYTYRNGVKNGIAKYAPEKGEYETVTYVNGVLNGPAEYGCEYGVDRYFYVNGKINGIAESINSLMYLEEYLEKGEITVERSKETYVDNVLHGPAEVKYTDGDIEVYNNVNGEKQGAAKMIYADGTVEEYEYINGIKVEKLDPNSKFLEDITPITKNKSKYKKYTQDGKYSLEGTIINGKKEGTWVEKYNGYTLIYNYFNDKLNGSVTKDFLNIKIEENYIDGKKNGVSKIVYTNNNYNIQSKAGEDVLIIPQEYTVQQTYVNDILNGPARISYSDGSIEEFEYIDGIKQDIGRKIDKDGVVSEVKYFESEYKDDFFRSSMLE